MPNKDTLIITPSTKPLTGSIEIPSDKSLSHRAVILGSICGGNVQVNNFSSGADCKNSANVIKNLGIDIEYVSDNRIIIKGKGLKGYIEPNSILDAGNSGTTIRLMLGLLSGCNIYSVITGDESLRSRPMARVIEPLKKMGAKIFARNNNRLAPVSIVGGNLIGINYDIPIASAQVKSCLLLAGMYAEGATVITEPAKSRDHTERMLRYLGADLYEEDLKITIKKQNDLEPKEISIVGDISSAAFFMVGASIVDGSSIKLTNVGINPTRSGIIKVLQNMGSDITIVNQQKISGEPVGDIIINSARLKSTTIDGNIIPTLIDEIPVIAVAAAYAEGTTIIKNAEDLRNKECDRLSAISLELTKMGALIEETSDGLIINGQKSLKGACECDSHHDHRIAMSIAIAALGADEPVVINNAGWIKISFPNFIEFLDRLKDKNNDKQVF